MEAHGLPRNVVSDTLGHKSGECLCGALAQRRELKELALWYPEVADRIFRLEQRVKAAGLDDHMWATRSKINAGQMPLDEEVIPRLCAGCIHEGGDDHGDEEQGPRDDAQDHEGATQGPTPEGARV
jgi:hypothetical protein